MSLSWSDITYDIPLPKKKAKEDRLERARQQDDLEIGTKISNDTFPLEGGYRRILAGVGGEVKQGQLVAILGATGAGKTTLLNILSARLSSVGKLQGRVLFHGKERDPQTWKRTVGFVEQDDVMLGLLTVQETLGYSAKMRLPDKLYTKEQKKQRVQETIDMLRLQKCSQTRIGSTTKRGISGGERKRTSIGVELVSDVSLLLLDEPTSGLDAYAAYSVVENLKNTARLRNLSCLMTIHQPSWRLLQLVDRVQLLARGKLYYDGTPSDMQAWFESLNHKVPEGANPADYYITLAENADESEEGEKRIEHLIQAWASKEEAEKGTSTDTQIDKNVVSANENTSLEVYKNWPTSIFSEIAVLTSRNAKQIVSLYFVKFGCIFSR
jgi:ABC-type multidrug transport system ATPase subunit